MILLVFSELFTPKEALLERLKSLASEHFSGIEASTGFKHCWNKHSTTINLFIHEYEINWVGKSLL